MSCCNSVNNIMKTNMSYLVNEFKPPKNIGYTLTPIKSENNNKIKNVSFIEYQFQYNKYQDIINLYPFLEIKCYEYFTSNTESLIILHIINKSSKIYNYFNKSVKFNINDNININKNTILFCNDQFSLISKNLPFYLDISINLKSDIISFDYSEYGLSKGKFTKDSVFKNIKSVLYFMEKNLKIFNENIILFGMGLGCIPILYINDEYNQKNLNFKGIILYSPIFPKNLEIQEINSPIYLIHGQKNQLSSYKYTNEFFNNMNINNKFEWYPEIGNYKNIQIIKRFKFYKKLKNFFSFINNKQTEKKIQKMSRCNCNVLLSSYLDNITTEDEGNNSNENCNIKENEYSKSKTNKSNSNRYTIKNNKNQNIEIGNSDL